jgi:hypothetical protein
MTVSDFLSKLADDLDRGPESVDAFKRWALLCRDYAMIASFFNEDGDMQIVCLPPVLRRKRASKPAVATIPVDAAEPTLECD